MIQYTYLDYAASAPLRPEVIAAVHEFLAQPYAQANPNSLHSLGRQCAQRLEQARMLMAKSLGGGFRPPDVVFTSGGTEANNLSILGIAKGCLQKFPKKKKIIFSAIEHDSVLDLSSSLKKMGFTVVLVRPNQEGRITASALESVLDDTVTLVSVMYANNETGVVQPIAELAQLTHSKGAYFHTDAVQAFGRIPLDLKDVDCVTCAAHKIGGLHGAGLFAIKRSVAYLPLVFGGGQEFNKRPGTQNVAACIAFAKATEIVMKDLDKTRTYVQGLAEAMYTKLTEGTDRLIRTTVLTGTDVLPGIVHVMASRRDSETMLLKLDNEGFEVSSGSACSSASLKPSHVLSAMNVKPQYIRGALRISFDERVDSEDLNRFCDCLLSIV